jgi:hypothetical protein
MIIFSVPHVIKTTDLGPNFMGKSNGRKNTFTTKGERLIKSIKASNKKKPKSKRVNPFAIATERGLRRKT